MAGFIDCSDSFWQVACHNDFEPADEPGVVVNEANAEPADEPDVVVGELIRIDNDPVCTELDSGYIICHS